MIIPWIQKGSNLSLQYSSVTLLKNHPGVIPLILGCDLTLYYISKDSCNATYLVFYHRPHKGNKT